MEISFSVLHVDHSSFLQVIPSSCADELLLAEVLELICHVVKYSHTNVTDTTTWLTSLMLNTHGPMHSVMKNLSNIEGDLSNMHDKRYVG